MSPIRQDEMQAAAGAIRNACWGMRLSACWELGLHVSNHSPLMGFQMSESEKAATCLSSYGKWWWVKARHRRELSLHEWDIKRWLRRILEAGRQSIALDWNNHPLKKSSTTLGTLNQERWTGGACSTKLDYWVNWITAPVESQNAPKSGTWTEAN